MAEQFWSSILIPYAQFVYWRAYVAVTPPQDHIHLVLSFSQRILSDALLSFLLFEFACIYRLAN